MLNRSLGNPWQVYDSDDEDRVDLPCNRSFSFPQRPVTSQALRRHHPPGIADWAPVIMNENEEGLKRRFGRKKTVPLFEKGLPDNKPIFFGPPAMKASSRSLPEYNQQATTTVNYAPDTPPASPASSNSGLFGMIQEDLNRFIYAYIPKAYPLYFRCCLRRDKPGLEKGLFPTYYLHTERPDNGRKIFLLAARKVAKLNRQSEYVITTDIETLSDKSGGDGCVGRLRANGIFSSEYTLYDNGKSPNKHKSKKSHSKQNLRCELAGITCDIKMLSSKGSREVNAVIPKVDHHIQPAQGETTIFDQWRDGLFNDIIRLENLPPEYCDEEKGYMFHYLSNSTIQTSVKNFQMIIKTENYKKETVMQFGRINADKFICDFRYPLSPIQAFGIALSSFDSGFI